MADYTLTLQSQADYRIVKKLLKAFDGARIHPVRKSNSGYTIKEALEEVKKGDVVGPFHSVEDLMKDLLS